MLPIALPTDRHIWSSLRNMHKPSWSYNARVHVFCVFVYACVCVCVCMSGKVTLPTKLSTRGAKQGAKLIHQGLGGQRPAWPQWWWLCRWYQRWRRWWPLPGREVWQRNLEATQLDLDRENFPRLASLVAIMIMIGYHWLSLVIIDRLASLIAIIMTSCWRWLSWWWIKGVSLIFNIIIITTKSISEL